MGRHCFPPSISAVDAPPFLINDFLRESFYSSFLFKKKNLVLLPSTGVEKCNSGSGNTTTRWIIIFKILCISFGFCYESLGTFNNEYFCGCWIAFFDEEFSTKSVFIYFLFWIWFDMLFRESFNIINYCKHKKKFEFHYNNHIINRKCVNHE